MPLQNYRELNVWQRAMDLVEAVYQIAGRFPAIERFGLTSQIQRAAVSVPANIAEGYGRAHRGDYLRFLSIARGSLCEVETYLILAQRLKYVPAEDLRPLWIIAQEVGRMLFKLRKSLEQEP